MRTTSKRKKDTNSSRTAWQDFISGDFLLDTKMKAWYPYILFLALLALLLIWNDRILENKREELRQKEKEYQSAVEDIKLHNNYINFGYKTEVRDKAIESGYVKNINAKYKLVINEEEEEL